MDDNIQELAEIKIERAIKLSERFDEIDVGELKKIILLLNQALQLIPNKSREKDEIQAYLSLLSNMEFEKFGGIFKGFSRKGNIIISKKELDEIIWRAHSLLF
jgi:hypothetical protein